MEQAENPSSSIGYYCHNCNNTISLPITNFSCPDCHQGFIEKLPDGPASASPFSERTGESRDDMDTDPLVVLNRVFDDISNNLGLEVIMGGGESNARNNDRPSSSSRRDATSNSSRPNDRRRGRNQYTGTFEQMLGEFLNNMSRAQNFDGNGPVLLVGNPGDYAWGREGLDTIVTQLLNQMDSSGPPPLAKDKINELPFVSITAQQVSENIQCSVCWDSFKTTEKVRQLPCDHIYHDLCIVPWLELHGTCPICRKLLSEDNEARLGFPHTGGLEALLSDVHRLSILQRTYTPSSSTTNNRRSHIQCFRCRNYGHYARECPQRPRAAGNTGNTDYRTQRSPSRAVPMHEFLEEFDLDFLSDSDGYIGSDDFDDHISDTMECEVCGLSSGEHRDFPCGSSPDGWYNGWNTMSPSGGSSVSASFAGFSTRHANDPQRPSDRKYKNVTCYKCKKRGHMERDCREIDRCAHCSKNHKSSDCWYAPDRTQRRSPDWSRPRRSPDWARPTRSPEWAEWSRPARNFRQNTDRTTTRTPDAGALGTNWNKPNRTNYRHGNQWGSDGSGPSTSRYPQSFGHENYRCFHCNEVGHIARHCPTAKRGGRARYCRSCGREGHLSRDCPVNL